MKKFEAFVPVDLKVTIEASSRAEASEKASRAVKWFIAGAGPYKLNLGEDIGAIQMDLEEADLDDEDAAPWVREVARQEVTHPLGDYCPIPADHPAFTAPE